MTIEQLSACAKECGLHEQEVSDALTRLTQDRAIGKVLAWQVDREIIQRDRLLRTINPEDLRRRQGEIGGLSAALIIISQK